MMLIKLIRKTIKFPFVILDLLLAIGLFPFLSLAAIAFRSKDGSSDRVGWGPTPIKPIHYNSKSLRSVGVNSFTFVDGLYSINNRSDFDFYLPGGNSLFNRLLPTLARILFFLSFLKRCDALITNFDGGLLRGSKLRFFEHFFLKIANKTLVVWPYGSDSFIYSKVADYSFRYGLYQSYPEAAKKEKLIGKQINYHVQNADIIIGNIPHHEALPRWDVLTVACYGVDTNEWKPLVDFRHLSDGKSKPIVIVHCPNHRKVKGTEIIIQAVSDLQREGINIDLRILEGVKNEEIREQMKASDIVIAQLLYGYASTEIEGMSLGKPVISNLAFSAYYDPAKTYTYFKECPLVSATPLDLKERLLELISSPSLRENLGKQGRDYVEKYHSLSGQGKFWSHVVKAARSNSRVELETWWSERS